MSEQDGKHSSEHLGGGSEEYRSLGDQLEQDPERARSMAEAEYGLRQFAADAVSRGDTEKAQHLLQEAKLAVESAGRHHDMEEFKRAIYSQALADRIAAFHLDREAVGIDLLEKLQGQTDDMEPYIQDIYHLLDVVEERKRAVGVPSESKDPFDDSRTNHYIKCAVETPFGTVTESRNLDTGGVWVWLMKPGQEK